MHSAPNAETRHVKPNEEHTGISLLNKLVSQYIITWLYSIHSMPVHLQLLRVKASRSLNSRLQFNEPAWIVYWYIARISELQEVTVIVLW